MKRILYLLLALPIIAAGCQSTPPERAAATPTLSFTRRPEATPVFDIDYKNPPEGWCQSESYAFGDFYCQDGQSHLVAKGTGNIAGWNTGTGYTDYIVQTQMRLSGDQGAYGIEFRGNDNPPPRFYIFEVYPNGTYRLIKWEQDNGITVLVPLTESSSLHPGEEPNLLEVKVLGSDFTLLANGQELATFRDASLKAGGAGPVALEEGHAIVDMIKIWDLPND